MSAAQVGRKHTDETRAKMSVSMRGIPKSAEARARMSASHKALHKDFRGQNAPITSLTDDDVREIRRLAVEGVVSQEKIGERFGIAQST